MHNLSHRLRRVILLFAGCVAAASSHATDRSPETDALIKRGEYVAMASDCAACHTTVQGKPFAGGLALVSPLGTIYSTNITPSTNFGIGRYTEEQFSEAIRHGIRADGANLYPAMPYTSYSILTDDDVHALYTYFRLGVTPVDVRAPDTKLPFPMNIRASLKVWNLLFLNKGAYQTDPHQSAEWNWGRYLVQGAAHCSVCHTPRGFMMQEEAGLELSGGQVGTWYAPNITSDATSGIGSWTREELVEYLRTGRLRGKAQAAGDMGEAVEHSFQYLSTADVEAIATYVKSVAPIHDVRDSTSRFTAGKMSSELAALRGTDGIRSDNAAHPTGAELFQGNCASCHSAQGQGSKDGYYPSLFHNSATGSVNANNLIATILYGVNRTTSKGQAYMPGFGGKPTDFTALSDQEIALAGNYVLVHYGRADASITAQDVVAVRRGGPTSPLVTLARMGIAAGVVLVLLILAFLIVRKRRRAH
ncbi:Fructose dehydrogenase cytochrome subunit [Paraburkholderia ultramafica]|uniref:Fructose dehydrogenase cytochrome subunit n=1 Tax=Paraburkholderia ultramafica TaxID=1544867 RepID=A0A6S7BQN9_9BURK|nr:cytochrome c [Paraburkholderia ultramafica]CAB3810014.1 Fructose dehydrogenase cytochrome subunit [Paraburkholderia ultramafica]